MSYVHMFVCMNGVCVSVFFGCYLISGKEALSGVGVRDGLFVFPANLRNAEAI